MKKLSYIFLSAMLALGVTACKDKPEEDPGKEKDPNHEYTPPEQEKTEKVEAWDKCKRSTKDPCETGSKCIQVGGQETFCIPMCDSDADCEEGLLCGDAAGYYDGYCVFEKEYFSYSMEGDFAVCPRDALDTNMFGAAYYANYFFTDAGKDDILPMLGVCTPVCNSSTLATLFDQVDSCPVATFEDPQADIFGAEGKSSICVDHLFSDDVNFALCQIVAADDDPCDDVAYGCSGVYGRKTIQYDENGKYIEGQDENGISFCSPELYFANQNTTYDPDTGMFTGFDEYARAFGSCITFCTDNTGCQCADAEDPNCKNLKDNQTRLCFRLKLLGAAEVGGDANSDVDGNSDVNTDTNTDVNTDTNTDVNTDTNTDVEEDDGKYIGGYCQVSSKCEKDSDCSAPTGYQALCVNPKEPFVYDGNVYAFPSDVTEKFCLVL